MRYLTAPLSLAFLFLVAGCDVEERQSMKVVPDRQGHAYSDTPGGTSSLGNTRVAEKGEIYITIQPKDTLTSIAKHYGVTVKWLIHRNDLRDGLPAAGTNLIVPGTVPPAK